MKRRVLPEDTYIACISFLLKRDFYPSLSLPPSDLPQDLPNLTLDTFLEKYTSHDSDSFQTLFNTSIQHHRDQFKWLYQLDDAQKLLLKNDTSWHHVVRNALMYPPPDLSSNLSGDLLIQEEEKERRGKEKGVQFENTRLNKLESRPPDTDTLSTGMLVFILFRFMFVF